MKTVILAGGYGTRITEETQRRPKPMIEIGGKPILWHIMKIYTAHGLTDFIICCGYRGYMIKEYFANYFLHMSDVTFDFSDNRMHVHEKKAEPWTVTLVDTGENTMTGGRLKKVSQYLDNDPFCFTYGDGLSDIDLKKLIKFHKSQKTLATVTAVRPPGRFGSMEMEEGKVSKFIEKPVLGSGCINGGFFVLSPGALDYIKTNNSVWEEEPIQELTNDGELSAFEHTGFWQPMDTLRDKMRLDRMWESGKAPWKMW